MKFRRPRGQQNKIERLRAITQFEFYHRFRDGQLSGEDYVRAMTATEDDRVMQRVLRDVSSDHTLNGYQLNWDDIITWISEHWWDILKIVLSIALLFAEEEPDGTPET